MRTITEIERNKLEKNPPSEREMKRYKPKNVYMTVGFFSAASIYERIWNNAPNNSVIMIQLPLGTSYFWKNDWTPEQAVCRLLERYDINATTLARWSRDFGRKPLDEFDAENPIPVA